MKSTINHDLLMTSLEEYGKVNDYEEEISPSALKASFSYGKSKFSVSFCLDEGHLDYKNSHCSCQDDECIHRYLAGILHVKGKRKMERDEVFIHFICTLSYYDMLYELSHFYDNGRVADAAGEMCNDTEAERETEDAEFFIEHSKTALEAICDTIFYSALNRQTVFEIVNDVIPSILKLYSRKSLYEYRCSESIAEELSLRCRIRILSYLDRLYSCGKSVTRAYIIKSYFDILRSDKGALEDILNEIRAKYMDDNMLLASLCLTLDIEVEWSVSHGDYHYFDALSSIASYLKEMLDLGEEGLEA